MAKKNVEILNAVLEQDEKLALGVEGDITTANYDVAVTSLIDNTDRMNKFLSNLVNKIGKTVIFSKNYENQLKMLKKGKLEFGDSLEQIFVSLATTKNFGENYDGAGTEEADLIRRITPIVLSNYVKVNYDKKAKTTIFDKQIRKAFLSETGLTDLLNNIVQSLNNALEYSEFLVTKECINYLVGEGKTIELSSDLKTQSTKLINTIQQSPVSVQYTDTKDLVTKIRGIAGEMKFPGDKYNLAKVKTFTDKKDLVLYVTPSISAEIDINIIAQAFNVSSVESNIRVIEVDSLPTGVYNHTTGLKDTTKVPSAILFDKELVQIYDTYQGAGTFYNAHGGYTNFFANREGIFAECIFANLCVFYK